jgi:hypothetical protein
MISKLNFEILARNPPGLFEYSLFIRNPADLPIIFLIKFLETIGDDDDVIVVIVS